MKADIVWDGGTTKVVLLEPLNIDGWEVPAGYEIESRLLKPYFSCVDRRCIPTRLNTFTSFPHNFMKGNKKELLIWKKYGKQSLILMDMRLRRLEEYEVGGLLEKEELDLVKVVERECFQISQDYTSLVYVKMDIRVLL